VFGHFFNPYISLHLEEFDIFFNVATFNIIFHHSLEVIYYVLDTLGHLSFDAIVVSKFFIHPSFQFLPFSFSLLVLRLLVLRLLVLRLLRGLTMNLLLRS